MDTVVVELDPQTSERARRLAQARGTTVTALVQRVITQLDRGEIMQDTLLGLFADEPALLDQVEVRSLARSHSIAHSRR